MGYASAMALRAIDELRRLAWNVVSLSRKIGLRLSAFVLGYTLQVVDVAEELLLEVGERLPAARRRAAWL